ncbi:hypothetical protein [Aridibaculum aurantiacum]|uniref:hypothetical protein n=1 Tax=Aridibaculum aurantiacum TaxID=2810307 RepID=UPI001A976192|nr:hypothetical protein [Aridibaculum aurantiacum]
MIVMHAGSGLIEKLLDPASLYTAASFFILATLITVIATFYSLYIKNKKTLFKNRIKEHIDQWIIQIISEEESEIKVPARFRKLLKNASARQVAIDELISSKRTFLGSVADNIVQLFYQLGLHEESTKKLDDSQPHIQCQGIHELCTMEQRHLLQKIYRYTNSKDPDVRIEAQSAMVKWYGFNGLRFLDIVSYPITAFQQLKLLELLRNEDFKEIPKLGKWLSSKNVSVIQFALKLAEHYRQHQVSAEAAHCLYHTDEAVRMQAIKTLATIGYNSTAGLYNMSYNADKIQFQVNEDVYLQVKSIAV